MSNPLEQIAQELAKFQLMCRQLARDNENLKADLERVKLDKRQLRRTLGNAMGDVDRLNERVRRQREANADLTRRLNTDVLLQELQREKDRRTEHRKQNQALNEVNQSLEKQLSFYKYELSHEHDKYRRRLINVAVGAFGTLVLLLLLFSYWMRP